MELLLRILKWSALAGGATLLLLALKGPLDRRYRAKWRYWLWLALAAALVLSPAPWGDLLPEGAAPAVEAPVTIRVPQTTIVVGQGGLSLAPQEELGESPLIVEPAAGSDAAQEALEQARQETKLLPLDAVLTAVWLAGAAALLAWRLAGSWAFARRARRWSRPASAEVLAQFDRVKADMGLRGEIPLAVCTAVDSPMAVGLFRPRLLLPGEDFGPQELDFILRHELTHIRRRDLWYKLALLLAQVVHWFNPLVWLLVRQAEADIELTCDDAVVAGRCGEDRRAYSETLLGSLHRQKGLAKAALSTHFYGGAEVMKARFRNILGGGQRRWGAAALTAALVLVAAAGCAVGVAAAEEPLGEEELAAWQEKLSDTAYNGFVASMYSDVSRLPVSEVFYNGAGVDHEMTDGEREAVLEAMGGDPDCPIVAVTAQAADDFLRENTGLGLDQIAGGFGSMWTYLPEYDSYYLAHGDTNYVSVTVTGGTRRGNTIELTIERPDGTAGLTEGVLTVADGEIQSYTTPLYTAVETMAWQLMNDQAAEYESADDGPTFVDRYVSDLWCAASFGIDGTNYSVWNVSYRLLPEDLSKVVLTGDMDLENGWLTESASMGSPVLVVSVDEAGNITLEEESWAYALGRDDGFTWEEYITCQIHMGMELTYKLGGWPELTTPFITDLLEGHNTWSQSWDSCAVAYLEELGVAPGSLTQVQEFAQPADGDCDESLLVRCDSGGDTLYLLLCHIVYPVESWNADASFWMVCGAAWEDGNALAVGVQEQTLYQRAVDFGGGHIGTLNLSGWQGNDCGGVSSVQVLWDDGSGTIFYTRDAIAAQWGQDSRDYFTDASSYVATEDGYAFDGGLKLLDVNFDGYLDIGLQAWRDGGSGSWYEYFWLFDPEAGSFRYAFCLRDVGADQETKEVVSSYTEGGYLYEEGVPYEDRYVWDKAGNLTLSRRLEGAAGTAGKATYSLVNGVCVILGEYDARTRLEWHLPSEVYPEGWLYVANPYFLGDSFRDKAVEGSAFWTDESREQLEVRLTENSPLNSGGTVDGPGRVFTVDIPAGTVLAEERHGYQGEEPVPLTEEELVRAAGLLAGVMGEAEAWVAERTASALDSAAWTEYTLADGIPLTAGELAGFEELFSGYVSNSYDACLYNGLLRFPFAGPEDAGYYLDLLFYDAGNLTVSGQRIEEVRSETEAADLRAAGVPIDNYDVQKIPRAQAQTDLARLFGLTEAEAANLLAGAAVKPGYLYLEEYDAYYSVHTDTWWHEYIFTGGVFYADGICILNYETDYIADFSKKPPEERSYWSSASMQLTIRQEDGSWVAVSNLGLSE